jgi:hypothetical protein
MFRRKNLLQHQCTGRFMKIQGRSFTNGADTCSITTSICHAIETPLSAFWGLASLRAALGILATMPSFSASTSILAANNTMISLEKCKSVPKTTRISYCSRNGGYRWEPRCKSRPSKFQILFPALDPNGVYICEDTHTAYWRGMYEGGYARPTNFIVNWPRLSEQKFRVDKWSVCRG